MLARRVLRSPLDAAQEPENIDNAVACLNHLARFTLAALPMFLQAALTLGCR